MSLTTFREHFRSITGMSPVQFQKMLRLQEARQLMLDQNMSAGRASALVGYESASQFNRDTDDSLELRRRRTSSAPSPKPERGESSASGARFVAVVPISMSVAAGF